MAERKTWTAEVDIVETPDRTESRVTLRLGDVERTGTGIARRNPSDPNVPRVGEELATARALNDLAHRLVDDSAEMLEAALGRPVALVE